MNIPKQTVLNANCGHYLQLQKSFIFALSFILEQVTTSTAVSKPNT